MQKSKPTINKVGFDILDPVFSQCLVTDFVYLGALSIGAMLFSNALVMITRETPWVIEMNATGGVLIVGISLILLELKRLRVANLLQAIFIAPALGL